MTSVLDIDKDKTETEQNESSTTNTSKNTYSVEEEEITNISSQKFCYHFDFPSLQESGYVEFFPNKIIIQFPDKHNENNKESYMCSKNINVFVNKEIKFSYQWLPIHTFYDFLRIKDMLDKSYYEFLRLLQWSNNEYYYQDTSQMYQDTPQIYNELITTKHSLSYNIYCFENSFNTSVELDINKTLHKTSYLPINLQIYIGNNLIFCLERDLKYLELKDIYIVFLFIMQKIK